MYLDSNIITFHMMVWLHDAALSASMTQIYVRSEGVTTVNVHSTSLVRQIRTFVGSGIDVNRTEKRKLAFWSMTG